MANDKGPHPEDRDERDAELSESLDASASNEDAKKDPPNPPRTTTGVWTSPKFGSAGSGGAELEPGPEKD